MAASLPPSGWPADAAAVRRRLRGVCLTPGTGEEALATTVVLRNAWEAENRHRDGSSVTDLVVAVQDLKRDFPRVETAVLVLSWFGSDLRASQCLVRPGTDNPSKTTTPRAWSAAGQTRSTAYAISTDTFGNARFGGTPGDVSIVECVRHLRSQGIRVILYPFLLMDIQAGNSLANPYTGGSGQPVQPWRGRITTDRHRSISSSTDGTSSARSHVNAFFGSTAAGDIYCSVNPTTNAVTYGYTGPAEWRFRRHILHYARLAAAINAVDAGAIAGMCVATEMVELLNLRDETGAYPGVEALATLMGQCKTILGSGVSVTYASDWSEWNGWSPPEGGYAHHLDPIWAAADLVAIDMYAPIGDWRPLSAGGTDGTAAGRSVYNARYLRSQVTGGELFDYTYANQAARDAQTRTPIADASYGEAWQYRRKDIKGWWQAQHFNRNAAGVRSGTATAWVPQSKPVVLTEFGFAKVNSSVNQPNVFVDPASSEGGYPRYSTEAADPRMQLSGLRAYLEHYREGGINNPTSSVYGGPMLRLSWSCAWSYEARPFPEFPLDPALGSDATRFAKSHSLNGNLVAGALKALDEANLVATAGQSNIEKWAYAEVDNAGNAVEPGGSVFRRQLATELGISSAQITMIYGAVGGSSLLKKMQWSQAGVPKGYWWDESVGGPGPLATALKAAVAGRQGTLRALLWDQGESDWISVTNLGGSRSPTEGMLGRGCTRAEYESAFAALIAWFRSPAGLNMPNLPVLISGIGANRYPPYNLVNTTPDLHEPVRDYQLTGIQEAQYKAASTITNVFDGPSRGQPSGDTGPSWSTAPERRTTAGEDIHLSGPGYQTQATRMAQALAPILQGTRTWSGALAWQGAAREIVICGETNAHFFFGGFPLAGGISGARRMKDVLLAAKSWSEGDLSITCHGHDGSSVDVVSDASRKYGALWDRVAGAPAVLALSLGDYLARRGTDIKALVMFIGEVDFFQIYNSIETQAGFQTSLGNTVKYLRSRSPLGNSLPIWWVRAGGNQYPAQYHIDNGWASPPPGSMNPMSQVQAVQDALVANAGADPGLAGMSFAAYLSGDPGGAADLPAGYFGFDLSAAGYRTLGERLAAYAQTRI